MKSMERPNFYVNCIEPWKLCNQLYREIRFEIHDESRYCHHEIGFLNINASFEKKGENVLA